MGVSAGKPIDIAALSAVSVVRIRKKLPPDEVKTVGGGCIVKWMLGGSESSLKQSAKSSVFLLTTTQVISKNDLIASNGSISVELLDGDKTVSFNLGDKCATDLLEPLPGRVLGGTGEALKEVSFIMIPVEKFDDRNWLWSKLQGNIFEKRSLTCSPPSDETLQSYILEGEVFCCVTCDDRTKNNRRFDTEMYCLEFDKGNSEEFVLTSVSSQECTEEIRRLKQDFYRGENPKGGLLISKDTNFCGMLAISPASNKIIPLFLPTLVIDNNGTTVGKDVCNIAGPTKTYIEAGGGPLKAIPDEHDEKISEEARNKMMRNNQDVPLEGENLGNGSTSEVQGSGNPVRNPQELANSSSGLDLVQADHENENLNPDFSPLPPEVDPSQDGNDHDDIEPDCLPSLPPVNADHAIPPEGYSLSPPAHHEPLLEDSDCSSNLNGDIDEQEQPLLESSGSPKPIPETEPPKQINEVLSDIRSSDESGDDLVSSTELERLRALRGYNVPRSLSESDNPSRSDGVQGSGPLTRQNTTPGNLERVFSGSLVKDKIVRGKASVMDVVCLHLDRPNCPGRRDDHVTPGWEQLADEFQVPEKIKSKCQNFREGNLSPSEAMFEHLASTSHVDMTIGNIKERLRNIRRNDIVDDISEIVDNNSNLSDDTTLASLWDEHPEIQWTVCLRLDNQRSLKNWMDLGKELGLSKGTLQKFKDPSGHSPSQIIIEKIKSSNPSLPITRIREVLLELNLVAAARKLDPLIDGDIKTLLKDQNVLEDVTSQLDEQESYWRGFALRLYNFSDVVLNSLRPVPFSSPTETVMNYIVQENNKLPMQSFLMTLKKMERNDLIEALKEFFEPQDIDDILQATVHSECQC